MTPPAPDGLPDRWDPEQYERFKAERRQPFFDLMRLVRLPLAGQAEPAPGTDGGPQAVDLGCGTGELTRALYDHLAHEGAAPVRLLGLDSSAKMLADAGRHAAPGLKFQQAAIEDFATQAVPTAVTDGAPWRDEWALIFSNAALQWVPDHARLIPQLCARLAPGGQLAVQVPVNDDHPAYRLADALAQEEPYAQALAGFTRRSPVEPPEWYARTLHACGLTEIEVYLRVYLHRLDSTDLLAEWVQGTLLNHYLSRLSGELGAQYRAQYRQWLAAHLPSERPYLFTFKRLFIAGEKA